VGRRGFELVKHVRKLASPAGLLTPHAPCQRPKVDGVPQHPREVVRVPGAKTELSTHRPKTTLLVNPAAYRVQAGHLVEELPDVCGKLGLVFSLAWDPDWYAVAVVTGHFQSVPRRRTALNMSSSPALDARLVMPSHVASRMSRHSQPAVSA